MSDPHRPSGYLEYRNAASSILTRDSGDLALKAFGLSDLLDGAEVMEDLTPVYALLEAQGAQVASTSALARLGLLGIRLGNERPAPVLAWPIPGGRWFAVPGRTAGTPVVVDRPGVGLTMVPGECVGTRPTRAPVADDYLAILELDPVSAVIVLPDEATAPLRPAMLARVQLGAAAELLGLCGRMLDDAIAYARIRRQFGRSIAGFQVMQHLLGWAAAERHQLVSMYDIAVEQTARQGPDPLLSAAVKALAGRVVHAIAQAAIQVTGAISFTWEYSLNRMHQRAMALDQFAGSSADLIAAMGRQARTNGALPELFGLDSDTGETPLLVE